MSMCVEFVLMKTNATAIAIAIAVYRSHPFHMRFNFFCSCYIVCYSSVVVMCGWCFLFRCSNVHFLLFFFPTQNKMVERKKNWLVHLLLSFAAQIVDVCDSFFFSFRFLPFFGLSSRSFSFGLNFSFFFYHLSVPLISPLDFFLFSGCTVGRFHVGTWKFPPVLLR